MTVQEMSEELKLVSSQRQEFAQEAKELKAKIRLLYEELDYAKSIAHSKGVEDDNNKRRISDLMGQVHAYTYIYFNIQKCIHHTHIAYKAYIANIHVNITKSVQK